MNSVRSLFAILTMAVRDSDHGPQFRVTNCVTLTMVVRDSFMIHWVCDSFTCRVRDCCIYGIPFCAPFLLGQRWWWRFVTGSHCIISSWLVHIISMEIICAPFLLFRRWCLRVVTCSHCIISSWLVHFISMKIICAPFLIFRRWCLQIYIWSSWLIYMRNSWLIYLWSMLHIHTPADRLQ